MYRSKAEVDKHVEALSGVLSLKELKSRGYSLARLYYEVGDYESCRHYVEQYISFRDNNAAAHKLLGQALQQLGQKEKALEQYKTSLDHDQSQTSLILNICELLADDEVFIDPGRAQYWCEQAETAFPRHPTTFRLRERLISTGNPDPEAVIKLLTSEIEMRPKDASLHARLLKEYLNAKHHKEAFNHSFNVEFGENNAFRSNFAWYEALSEVLSLYEEDCNSCEWQYQLLKLTIRERLCALSLNEIPVGSGKSLVETGIILHSYDQDLQRVSKAGPFSGAAEFHSSLLQHHRGQFSFYAACFLLKKAKKDQLNWREAARASSPLLLLAWHNAPLDTTASWLTYAPEKQQAAARRWHMEGSYRCSQAGHCLLANVQERCLSFVDRVSQFCSGSHWKDKLYEKIFTNREQLAQIKTSHFLSDHFANPILRLPRKSEVQAFDTDAQKMHPSSLHHIIWILMNYKNYAHFKCVLFDMLKPACQNYPNCGPETLNKLDVDAFLYSATLTAAQHRKNVNHSGYQSGDRPNLLPANITDLICSLTQTKWWDCAYKVSQNELGTELSDIRVTLCRGIEVVRCVDNHGMDPQLLCTLGRIFSERAKLSTQADEKTNLEARANLYYTAAIPLLERLKSKMTIRIPEKRMFEYTHSELSSKEISTLIEESKLYLGVSYMNENEYEKAIEILYRLKSAHASFHLGQIYYKMANEEIGMSKDQLTSEGRSKHVILLSKAKEWVYTTNERLKNTQEDSKALYSETQALIEKIESQMSRIDPDISNNVHDYDGKYSSDENVSSGDSHIEQMHLPLRTNNTHFRNISSTPKNRSGLSTTHYKTAVDSHMFDNSRSDHKHLDRIESQIKNLHKKDSNMNAFMEQTKSWIEENRHLGDEVRDLKKNLADKIINSINSNIQDTVDQFKLLKISVDQVKEKIGEYRDECKTDVGDLKKEVADLKKEVNKLKKSTSDQTADESDIYNLEQEYQASTSQLPLSAPAVLPAFSLPRMIHPAAAAYSLYGQDLYALYNQCSQLAQPPQVPTAPLFDATRPPVNYAGVYQPTEQMYSDVSHFLPSNIIPTSTQAPMPPAIPPIVSRPVPPPNKEIPRSLPVNVVITSSDPLPTRSSVPQPVLSVTIPPEHIKNSPHNYQITLPSTVSSTIFNSGTLSTNVTDFTPAKPFGNWNQASSVNTTPSLASNTTSKVCSSFDNSKSGYFSSPQTGIASPQAGGLFGTPSANLSMGMSFSSPNMSLNKSRTLSEKSNTSVENYDPCPDFKPIIPLPAEVEVKTGEENEITIFTARAKLFRFVDKEWKERGLGEMKLLKHKMTGKVRVLMRREQVHKICANHIITPDMELQLMKNETKAYIWVANDFADGEVVLEKFCVRFKTGEIAENFYETFEKARNEAKSKDSNKKSTNEQKVDVKTKEVGFGDKFKPVAGSWTCTVCYVSNKGGLAKCVACESDNPTLPKTSTSTEAAKHPAGKTVLGGFTFSGTPNFKTTKEADNKEEKPDEKATKPNPFSNLSFKSQTNSPFANIFTASSTSNAIKSSSGLPAVINESPSQLNTSDVVEEFEPSVEFKPVIPLPALIEQKTGEEDEIIAFEHRSKLLRYDTNSKEWKERGLGDIKLLVHKDNEQKVRLLMRREIVMKVCCNHAVTKELRFQKMPNQDKAVTWCARDFSEGELTTETFCLRFKTADICNEFMKAIEIIQSKLRDTKQQISVADSKAVKEEKNAAKQTTQTNVSDKVKPLTVSTNKGAQQKSSTDDTDDTNLPLSVANWGDKFKPKVGSWECAQCLIRNDAQVEYCSACESPKDPSKPKKEAKSILDDMGAPKFSFGIPKLVTDMNDSKTSTNLFLSAESKPSSGQKTFSFGIKALETPKQTTNVGSGPFTVTPLKPEDFSHTTPFTKFVSAKSTASSFSTPPKESKDSFAKESGTFDFVMKPKSPGKGKSPLKSPQLDRANESDDDYCSEDEGHHIHFTPVIPMPEKVEVQTGEENETELYCHRAKLFRFVSGEWKERGLGNVKILKHKETGRIRVLMRREHIHKICLNHALTAEVMYNPKDEKTWLFTANDFSEGELNLQQFCLRFKSKDVALEFKRAVNEARENTITPLKVTSSTKIESAKTDESDDVVFVGEIQSNSQEKIKAKQLMLPENFFTYKNKPPCSGCRGCEEDDAILKTAEILSLSTPAKSEFFTPSKNALNENSPTNSIFATPTAFNKTADTSVFRTPLESLQHNTSSSDEEKTLTNEPKNYSIFRNKENSVTPKSSIFGGSGDSSVHSSLFGTPSQATAFGSASNIFGNKNAEVAPKTKAALLATPKWCVATTKPEQPEVKSVFGTEGKFGPIGDKKAAAKSIFGTVANAPAFGVTSDQKTDAKSIFGIASVPKSDNKSIFGTTTDPNSENKSVFGLTEQKPGSIFGFSTVQNQNINPVFGASVGESKQEQVSIFGGSGQSNIFTGAKPTNGVFGGSIFGGATSTQSNMSFGSAKSVFGNANTTIFGSEAANAEKTPNLFSAMANASNQNSSIFGTQAAVKGAFGSSLDLPKSDDKTEEAKPEPFSVDKSLSFAALSTSEPATEIQKPANFQWEGAGQQLFVQKVPSKDSSKLEKSKEDSTAEDVGEEDYDPHYEPIVPLPDKIVVTTGEEDEEKLFGERAKLYRYDDKTREWKERGVGEMKLLFHPARNTYRLLLRREQVHKAVLNTLLHKDLELLPMKNSDRAWTWAAVNYADGAAAGESEALAVRFKSVELANNFRDKVVETVRKLQVADAQAYREEKERKESGIRLPKSVASLETVSDPSVTSSVPAPSHQEPEGEQGEEDEGEGEEQVYEDYDEDYEDYYNEEEEQVTVVADATGEATVSTDSGKENCPEAHLQLLFDSEMYAHKLFVTDNSTGEILVDTVVYNETPFQISEDLLTWSGTDYTTNTPVEKTVSFKFPDEESCQGFYQTLDVCKNDSS